MNTQNNKRHTGTKILLLLVALLVLGAGLVGWRLGRSTNRQSVSAPTSPSQGATTGSDVAVADVRSLVTYTLPDGWTEATCPNAPGAVSVMPAGAEAVDCGANPSSAIKISVDPSNTDDCNDLQNVQNVRKHTCISLYINDKKSLKAETIYTQDSSYKTETSIHAYYINTGKGVIKIEYIHHSDDNEHQAGLDQLARSVQVR